MTQKIYYQVRQNKLCNTGSANTHRANCAFFPTWDKVWHFSIKDLGCTQQSFQTRLCTCCFFSRKCMGENNNTTIDSIILAKVVQERSSSLAILRCQTGNGETARNADWFPASPGWWSILVQILIADVELVMLARLVPNSCDIHMLVLSFRRFDIEIFSSSFNAKKIWLCCLACINNATIIMHCMQPPVYLACK